MAVHHHVLAERRDRDVGEAVAVDVADRGRAEHTTRGVPVEQHCAAGAPAVDATGRARDDDVLHAVAVPVDERGRALHRAPTVPETGLEERPVERDDARAAVHPAGDDLGHTVTGDVADGR